jgi:hypothetical protein
VRFSFLCFYGADYIINFFLDSRKAVMKAHPDKGGTEAKMAAVNEAYEVLSDPGTFRYCSHSLGY